ncbi:MAG TPA: glycosyltransferase [Novosphingobium sp.]
MDRPVFFDDTGRRNRWTVRGFIFLLLLVATAVAGLAATILLVPRTPSPRLGQERAQALPLKQQLHAIGRDLGKWLPFGGAGAGEVDQIVVGFYVPWDPASAASLAGHVGELDWVVPAFVNITGAGTKVDTQSDPAFARIIAASGHSPRILPMIQNAKDDTWDGAGMAQVLADPAKRAALAARSEAVVAQLGGTGVVFDFEELPASAQQDYVRFLSEVRRRFAPRKWLVTLTAPVDDPSWNLPAIARSADRVFLMNYDEHSSVDQPGPIASQGWFVDRMQAALKAVPADKAIVAIGSYAYDWHGGMADSLSDEEAWLAASDSEATVVFDQASGNSGFSYEDDDGSAHTIWLLDAASAWNQLRAIDTAGASGVALWRLGSEDPGVWPAFDAFQKGVLPDMTKVKAIGDVDVEGNGELLRITATPTDGLRHFTTDKSGLVRDVHWLHYPTPFVVQRGGAVPKLIALTFDDGPDPTWTPQILSILEEKKAPGTFFVIGENAISHPALLNRIVASGGEIGSHSYTHPNMANVSQRGIELELDATQRLIEAYTGRSTRLFRAPYFGDAEPTTPGELVPAWIAQNEGYLNVGLHVDPNDWQRPPAQAIVDQVIAGVESDDPQQSEHIVLLHDGGGDRSHTVAALPVIIDGLRARGYTLVPVSKLLGVPRDAIMPPVKGSDLAAVRLDIGVFLVVAGLLWFLKWLFFVAISVGIIRAIFMAALALRSASRGKRRVPPPIDPERFVSVLIPAFNEAKVIVDSIRRVLASDEVRIEVIVIDDGSSDGTSAVVEAAFSQEPRVRLLTLENGGKARALNEGLKLAGSDIVIALDADTQFEAETIARLARWFVDPQVGAVAGNAKVGNRVNLVTRWQAVEYVTAQNLERRALMLFDAITVVPGAVGAWRRTALDSVGGYPTDTLAEDQDLTIAIQRQGWRVDYDADAIAWTESPESFRALVKQRFRWAYGTLQCLWKHRAIVKTGEPKGLARIGIPQAWIFQIGFALISPIIDLALAISIVDTLVRVRQHGWAQTQSDVLHMGAYWLVFTAIDILCGWIAYRLEKRERRYPAHLLVAQRFVYRQLMYWVVVRAVAAALRGPRVGWGKLERTGRSTEQQA